MYMDFEEKLEKLKRIIKSLESVAVAYSGGVDSSYLLITARDILGKKVIALTGLSPVIPKHVIKDARKIARTLKIRHILVRNRCLDIDDFKLNSVDRCYVCKKNMFLQFLSLKNKYVFKYLIDGTNYDDLSLYRPGLKALKELGVRSPLAESGFTKDDIRKHSKIIGLPGYGRPSMSCLATRIPFGEEITEAKLNVIDQAEDTLRNLGFKDVRVRYQYPAACIEVPPESMEKILKSEIREVVISKLKALGFEYIVLDLTGYGKGSEDETKH